MKRDLCGFIAFVFFGTLLTVGVFWLSYGIWPPLNAILLVSIGSFLLFIIGLGISFLLSLIWQH